MYSTFHPEKKSTRGLAVVPSSKVTPDIKMRRGVNIDFIANGAIKGKSSHVNFTRQSTHLAKKSQHFVKEVPSLEHYQAFKSAGLAF